MTQRLRLSLGAWRRLARKLDSQRSSLSWRTSLAYTLGGAAQSLLMRIQDASHSDALATLAPPPPIFLLGFWRSGTTFLHELICCDPRFGFPSTYACLNPAQFLLSEKWIQKQEVQSARRPMDEMRYSWSSPQEDEFALLDMGAPSPYEALIVPSLMRDPSALVDFGCFPVEAQERWRAALRHFLQLLTLQQAKPMVLKSPPHGFRLSALMSMFSEARYILIERNPYEVFASNLKLWRTLTGLYSLESTSEDEMERFILEAYVLHEKAIAEATHQVRPQTLARVRYEDLLVNPIAEIERLYQELGLENFGQIRPRLETYVAGVSGHKRNHFRISREQKARVDKLWGNYIRAKEYSWPEEYVVLEEALAS